ncbi:hypothetical protein E2C01_080678 [Portunus trituberculatus]|uniref:Uncharacterized protein n=1 Tax=Portunus trituberculatus TaxID=210409 RepID=A0A5B7IUN9_PORTR|nr:hypothetical protein [Portunus trituberculatus]
MNRLLPSASSLASLVQLIGSRKPTRIPPSLPDTWTQAGRKKNNSGPDGRLSWAGVPAISLNDELL